MTTFSQLDPLWTIPIAFTVIALGLMLVWRPPRRPRWRQRPARAANRHAPPTRGLPPDGWVGLDGAGAAMIWRAQWLLLLALGIGFVEILESSNSSPSGSEPSPGRDPANVSIEGDDRQTVCRSSLDSSSTGNWDWIADEVCSRRSRQFRPESRRARRRSRSRVTQ